MWPSGNKELEHDALLCCVKGWATLHNRFYDVPHFDERIRKNLDNLELTIYMVQSTGYLAERTYVKFIALFEKK